MSVIIHGLDMPKYTTKAEFGIDADGNPLCMVYHEDGTEPDIYDVVPLPEGHGRLIDADALIDALETQDYSCAPDTLEDWTPQDMTVAEIADITHAPTIVPAEGGTDDG